MSFTRWTGHGTDHEECCATDKPCAFHARFPDAWRSPHVAPSMQRTLCPECPEYVAPASPIGSGV